MSLKPQPVIKNIKISQKYGVSRPTVGKWVDNALSGKNNLQLTEKGGRQYIMDNKHNTAEIMRLKDHGVKYRNKIAYESVEPTEEFYSTFKYPDLVDLISSLENENTIPMKYAYFNGGAAHWDNFIRDITKSNPKYIKETTDLYATNFDYILYKTAKYSKINLIDIGAGTGVVVKEFLELLDSQNKDFEYHGIDFSQPMLDILKNNLDQWLPNRGKTYYNMDFEKDELQRLLFNFSLQQNSCNILLLFGDTSANYKDKVKLLSQIQSHMGPNDILLFDSVVDLEILRTSFESFKNKEFKRVFDWIVESLGITKDMYTEHFIYNTQLQARQFNIELNKDIDINIRLDQGNKVINFKEGTMINLFYHHAVNIDILFTELNYAGLKPINFTLSRDEDFVLAMAKKQKFSTH